MQKLSFTETNMMIQTRKYKRTELGHQQVMQMVLFLKKWNQNLITITTIIISCLIFLTKMIS